MKDTIRINQLKEDFYKTKTELETISLENRKINDVLQTYLNNENDNHHHNHESKTQINKIYLEDKNFFKEKNPCQHEICDIEINESIHIEKNNSENEIQKPKNKKKQDDILSFWDPKVKELLGIFLTYGLEDKKLKNIFDNKFETKYDFVKLFLNKNHNKLVINLFNIIFDLFKVENKNKNLINILDTDKFLESINDKNNTIIPEFNNTQEINKVDFYNTENFDNMQTGPIKSIKNKYLSEKILNLEKIKNENINKIKNKRFNTLKDDFDFKIEKNKSQKSLNKVLKKSIIKHSSPSIKYTKLKNKKLKKKNSEIKKTSKSKFIKGSENYKSKKHFPDRENYIFHKNNLK